MNERVVSTIAIRAGDEGDASMSNRWHDDLSAVLLESVHLSAVHRSVSAADADLFGDVSAVGGVRRADQSGRVRRPATVELSLAKIVLATTIEVYGSTDEDQRTGAEPMDRVTHDGE